MNIIRFLDRRAEEVIIVACLGLMTAAIGVQVFMRYIMQDALSWSEELARYLFIFFVYSGISYGVKMKRHIKVEAFVMWMPARIQLAVGILSDLMFLVFALLVVRYGYVTASRIFTLRQTSPALELPMGYVYGTLPFCYVLVIIRLLQNLGGSLAEWFGRKGGE